MTTPPLAHLRVVDLSDIRAALAGRLLADLGADVIKVEPPGGDPDRWRPPFAGNVAAPDRSLPFLYRNANKRGAVIDLHSDDGWRRFVELCDRADILIENLGPVGQRQCRLTPAAVRARHPQLIHLAIADFGLSGPRAGWRLEALPALAASGALSQAGFLDRPPCWLPGYLAHDCASVFGVAGALAALLDRTRHGQGQSVEISVQEAALAGTNPWSIPLADYARVYPMLAPSPPRNADGNYPVLPVADGYVRVLTATTRHWRAFVELLGSPPELAEPAYEVLMYRVLMGETIRQIAAAALRPRTRAEVFAEARRRGIPLAPVNTPDEFVATEQSRARGTFQATGFPHVGEAPFAGVPFRLSATPAAVRRPAPIPGEDDGQGFAPRSAEPPAGTVAGGPLTGIRVVHFGVVAVVPEMTWLLAELGADVIKIESHVKLDPLRAVTLEPDAPNKAFTFNDECRGQQSVCLDLRTPRGRELALQLCATADIVAENNRGGVMREWQLDYEDVRRARPDVIYLSSQGYGHTGPLAEQQAFGPMNSAFSGMHWLWNHDTVPYPAGCSLNHPDHVASKLGVVAVLAALAHRRRTGAGQFIDLAQTEAGVYLLGEFYLEGACTGRPATARGNAVDYAVPHGVYPCAGEDRWCAIAVVGDDAWTRFQRCLGWAPEPRWVTLAGRLTDREAIEARVSEWTRARAAEHAASVLQAAGVSAMAVLSPDDLRADRHLAARGAIVTLEHPEVGAARHSGNPLRLSRSRLFPAGPAPLLGQHTEAVLARVLGLSPAEIARLADEGVCW
ncbi:MAG: CoA transferase [Deltaproteobacteria bacterium]|nr:CoA transferase [Deltaproteobacteria bacterium]